VRARKNTKTEKFKKPDISSFFPAGAQKRSIVRQLTMPDAARLKHDEYMIPHVNAVPVKMQGQRGTCAAFCGTAHLEYAVLKLFPSLSGIDLAEQRFYYLSKPECHDSGCTLNEEGSWYGTGMESSMNSPEDYDIPLEADCPYNDSPGTNDIQIPQASGCSKGAVKIVGLKYVAQLEDMIDILENDGLPVPYASPLSGNWETNTGLITFADSGYSGSTVHASGHAYLIVGYRKLPDMEDEGGMCFIIKNSWDVGWGVNGFSCMTAKWMTKWAYDYDYDQPVVTAVALRDDVSGGAIPDNSALEDELSGSLDPEIIEDDSIDWDKFNKDEDAEIPDGDPAPETLAFDQFYLLGPGDQYYQAQLATSGGKAYLQGVVRNDGKATGVLDLELDGDYLLYDGDRVGEIKNDELVLCSGEYDLLCSLRFDVATNRLYIEFLNPEFRRVRESELPEGSWTSFISPIAGYSLELYQPEGITDLILSKYAYLRLVKPGGKTTDAVRLRIDSGEIKVMGTSVGNINPSDLGLCSGEYSTKCSVFAGDETLEILPTW
jgi:hypothetical protein